MSSIERSAGIVLVFMAAAGMLAAMSQEDAPRRPACLVIAHRGGCGLGPENTLEAAAAGHAAGADLWELDAQLCKDGVPVLLHDETLGRTTDVRKVFPDRAGRPVGEFTLAELKRLDAGSWWALGQGGKALAEGRISKERLALYGSGRVRVPTLEEALELTRELGWRVNVEIKSPAPGSLGRLVPEVLAVIRKTGMASRAAVSCFDHAVCLAVARSPEPRPRVQVLQSGRLARPERYVKEIVGAEAFNPSLSSLGLGGADEAMGEPDPALVLGRLRQAGLEVNVWTVNRPEQFETLIRLGVTGIITDRPDLLRAFLAGRR